MIKLGEWSIRRIPHEFSCKFPNYEEKFFIYYKNCIVGSLFYCEFDNEWWARILREKIRKKFYSDDDKFHYNDVIKLNTGKILCQKQNNVLSDMLVKLYQVDTENQNYEGNFYCRVILGECFDKIYTEKISNKQIIKDIKAELPRISETLSDKEIKKSIIKIFQFPDLIMKLNGKICKERRNKFEINRFSKKN